MIRKFANIEQSLIEMRETGHPRGENTGFKCLDELYSIKQGSYTFILAPPHHGKSEFAFELAFNQAIKYGKKSLVYSPETGSTEDIYAEFVHKYTGKPFYKSIPGSVEDKEFYQAINYIDEMFSIVDSDEQSYSFQDLTNLCTNEKLIVTDPYNELKHDMSQYGTRQDLYIEDLCGEIRRYCKKYKKHWILTLHPANQLTMTDKSGFRYFPMPMAREAAGGQALFRKAMTWINLWRPPTELMDDDGHPYKENQTIVKIEKAKPKGVAVRGTTNLYFDWKRNRFYEHGEYRDLYAFEHESAKVNIREPLVEPKFNEEAPF